MGGPGFCGRFDGGRHPIAVALVVDQLVVRSGGKPAVRLLPDTFRAIVRDAKHLAVLGGTFAPLLQADVVRVHFVELMVPF